MNSLSVLDPSTWILVLSLVCALTDVARGKIYNVVVFPAMILGILIQSYQTGFSGAGSALFGIGLGLVLYGWMFALKTMGAGDVKLLMALGALGGPKYVFLTAFLGVILGGILALFLLAFQKRLPDFAGRLKKFLLSVLVKELEPVSMKIDKKLTMPFGVPIAAAAIWLLFENPLKKWGILDF